MVSAPAAPSTSISEVLATVAGPPVTGTAPALTNSVPPALRETRIPSAASVPMIESLNCAGM
jgi:hypothetical protein